MGNPFKWRPSDYTKEMVRTEGALAWGWVILLIVGNSVLGIQALASGEINEGFLHLLVALLFIVMHYQLLLLNMSEKIIQSLAIVTREQSKIINDALDQIYGPETTSGFDGPLDFNERKF